MRLTTRFSAPQWICRGKLWTVSVNVYDGSQPLRPTAATYTLIDPAGVKVIDAQSAFSLEENGATYRIAADVTTSYTCGANWSEEWALTINGSVHTVYRDAVLVKAEIAPVITLQDLFDVDAILENVEGKLNQKGKTLQRPLDAAWDVIVLKLMEQDRFPWLVLNRWALKQAHTMLAMARAVMYDSERVMSQQEKMEKFELYMKLYKEAFSSVRLVIDEDQDGKNTALDSNSRTAPESEPSSGSRMVSIYSDRWNTGAGRVI